MENSKTIEDIKKNIISLYSAEKSIFGLFTYQDLIIDKELNLYIKFRKNNKPNIILGKEMILIQAIDLHKVIPTFVEDAINTVMAVKKCVRCQENEELYKEDILQQVDRIKSAYLKFLIISPQTQNNLKHALYYFGFTSKEVETFLNEEYLKELSKLEKKLVIKSEKSKL